MKRIVSLLLATCLAMALSVSAFAAATGYSGGLSAEPTEVEVGESVVVTMSLPENALATIQLGISFDSEYLEITELQTPGEDMTGYGLSAVSDIDTANADGLLAFALVGAKGDNVLKAGADDVITITMKTLKTGETTVSVAADDQIPLIMESLQTDGVTPEQQFEPNNDSVTITITDPAYILGDANGDGKVNMADVTAIRRYIANSVEYPLAVEEAADVNGDEKINMADVTAIRRYIANSEEYPLG